MFGWSVTLCISHHRVKLLYCPPNAHPKLKDNFLFQCLSNFHFCLSFSPSILHLFCGFIKKELWVTWTLQPWEEGWLDFCFSLCFSFQFLKPFSAPLSLLSFALFCLWAYTDFSVTLVCISSYFTRRFFIFQNFHLIFLFFFLFSYSQSNKERFVWLITMEHNWISDPTWGIELYVFLIYITAILETCGVIKIKRSNI